MFFVYVVESSVCDSGAFPRCMNVTSAVVASVNDSLLCLGETGFALNQRSLIDSVAFPVIGLYYNRIR